MAVGVSGNSKLVLQRSYTQAVAYATADLISLCPVAGVRTGYADYIGSYGLMNIAPFVPVYINESVLRGQLCGIYWLLQKRPYPSKSFIVHSSAIYIALNCAAYGNGQIVIKVGDL